MQPEQQPEPEEYDRDLLLEALGLPPDATDDDIRAALVKVGLIPPPDGPGLAPESSPSARTGSVRVGARRRPAPRIRPGAVLALNHHVAVPPDAPQGTTDPKAWAHWGARTGRYPAWRQRHWEAVVRDHGVNGIATLIALAPVLAADPADRPGAGPGRNVYPGDPVSTSDTPLADELFDAVFGEGHDPRSRERMRQREDQRLENELAEQLDAEAEAAAERDRPLTVDERRELFGE